MTIKETKAILKNMAAEIRSARKQLRQDQRDGKLVDQWGLMKLSINYRWRHIAYCMARGRTHEQIEPHYRIGNSPNWDEILPILKHIQEAEAARRAAWEAENVSA